MNPWQFLLQYLPSHWPSQWQGSYQQTADGPSTTVTVTASSHDLEGGEPTITFTFTDGGASHTIEGKVIDVKGDAQITLDGVSETDHPVLNVGTAFHFPPSITAIVHLIFNQNGRRYDYRFEGKVD